MHFQYHSMHKPLFLGVREDLLIILLIKAIIPMVCMIACGLCFIWQPSFVKNYCACCSRHSIYVFFNRFISRIEKSSNNRDQTEVSFLKDFSKNPYTFTYVCHHTDLFFQKLIYLFLLWLFLL